MATVISTGHLCPSVCDCTAQGRVDCSQRELAQVPPGIPPSTRYLDLSKNNLRNIDPNAFRGLKKLRTLNLRRNHLRSIPKGLDEVTLHKLDLRLNLISSLSPADVMALSQIRSVDLSRNFIKEWPRVKEKLANTSSKIEKL
ncbi:leucine Rich repeat-containing domain protein [Ostertagia ostertagi]